MEIIVLPYMVISFMIGWAIFSPFAAIEDLKRRSFGKVHTIDLLAVFLTISYLFAIVKWSTSTYNLSTQALVAISVVIFMFVSFSFATGLFLIAKMHQPSSLKRISIIAIVIPLGSLLTFAWIALPLLAYAGSYLYAMPATLAIIPATLLLRSLSWWVCKGTVNVNTA